MCIRDSNRDYLQSTVSSRTTVLIFSDGCDTDTPEQLKVQLETISRQARRIIWVNPLLGRFDGGYNDPRMETIVPLLDHYMSAHNLPSLQKLQQVLLR